MDVTFRSGAAAAAAGDDEGAPSSHTGSQRIRHVTRNGVIGFTMDVFNGTLEQPCRLQVLAASLQP